MAGRNEVVGPPSIQVPPVQEAFLPQNASCTDKFLMFCNDKVTLKEREEKMFLNAFRMLGLYWASVAFLGGISPLTINHSSRPQSGCNFTLPGCGRFVKMAITLLSLPVSNPPMKRQHLFPQLLLLALSCTCFGQWVGCCKHNEVTFPNSWPQEYFHFSLTLSHALPCHLNKPKMACWVMDDHVEERGSIPAEAVLDWSVLS